MQALFNTQPGNGNLFADRVRPVSSADVAQLLSSCCPLC